MEIDVKTCGAIVDGVADETSAIQNALAVGWRALSGGL